MKFLAASITDYVVSQLAEAGSDAREVRVILPSLSSAVALNIGKSLQEHCYQLKRRDTKVSLIYKIAYQLGRAWQDSADAEVKSQYEEIKINGWYDEKNQLTHYRNIKRNPQTEDFLLTVIVGWDRVTDQASLADFFRLDYKYLWNIQLKSTFASWLNKRLQQDSIEFEESHLLVMDQLLNELVEASLADLPQISDFLEKMDFTDTQDGRDAFLIMVQNLGFFKLPCLRGFATGKKKKRFLPYMTAAIEFFNYSTYLDSQKIKKDIKTIEDFENNFTEEVDSDDLGNYENIENLLSGLKKYIESNDAYERGRLKDVSFVFILDRILGFKPSGSELPQPSKVKKISGMPLAAVLRAIWLTLGDFKAKTLERKSLAIEEITAIEIAGERFRHDGEGYDDTAKEKEMLDVSAHHFLTRMIGGIDQYIENHISFAPDPQNALERVVRVSSALCPPIGSPSSLAFEKTIRAEPYLRFRVQIKGENFEVKRQFIWRIPQTHPYRTVSAMVEWLYKDGLTTGNPLPVFLIPFFEEIIQAKDDDEVNRLLQLALKATSKRIHNLLISDGIDHNDALLPLIQNLSFEYSMFARHVYEKGMFYALESFNSLHKAYRKTYEKYLKDSACRESQLGPLLFRAYFMTGEHSTDIGSNWMWRDYEPSCIISPLHPAVLEMMFHQHAFFCESFEVSARKALQGTGTRPFSERIWNDIEDLAKIQWPICGILREGQIFDTNMRSFELIHLVGENTNEDVALTTRLMLRTEETEEDISDEDLFRETRESRLICRQLLDYMTLHHHAKDGIAIAAYCSGNVQPIIAGIDAYLSELTKNRDDRIYTLSLTLFAESQDDSTVSSWISEWRERWQEADSSNKYAYYSNCRISIAHRLVTREKNYSQFRSLLTSMDLDVAFMVNFIRAESEGNPFQPIDPYDHSKSFRMFPVLEKACCSIIGGGKETVRERMISNRQFVLGSLHADVMAKLTGRSDGEYVVLGRGDFSPWRAVIDELHRRSAWVVCIDPSVDERLISKENEYGVRQREIIGFGSGVGAHGEYNYTVSTECFSMSDIKAKISAHVAAKLGPWEQATSQQIAESIMKESLHMAGLSLVKATGPSQYVRDYLAYGIVRKLLKRDPSTFCDELISLDAYRHWFDMAPTGEMPDLIRVKATVVNGCFNIEMQLIECKLANESERHLQKAREQLENGLYHLISCFRPRSKTKSVGLDDRPDQRYWWLQLHRLIASKGHVKQVDYNSCISALERLSDGFFTIKWKAAAVTFWTDSQSSVIEEKYSWDFIYDNIPLSINVIQSGRNFIKVLCTEDIQATLPLGQDELLFSSLPDSVLRKDIKEGERHIDDDTRYSSNGKKKETTKLESLLDSKKAAIILANASDVTRKVPDRIFLGRGLQSGRQVYWEFGHHDLANRHMLIFGTSGMGKTYAIQALICELGRSGRNSLIVDYTNGFHDKQLDPLTKSMLQPAQHIVRLAPVPINPFRQQCDVFDELRIPEDPSNTAQRISGVFSEVYSFGDQQKAALYSAIKNGIENIGDHVTLNQLIEELRKVAEDNPAAASVISKIQPFVDMMPFGAEDPESWEKLFNDKLSRSHILQLAGFSKDAAQLITEFSLIDLYWFYRGRGSQEHPRVIILDEIQNLDHRLESPLGKFLTEGRKFGISLILATQTLSNLDKDERDRLFQASHKLFFRPADTELKSYAQILENAFAEKSEIWVPRLAALKKGECYSLGPSMNLQGKLESKAFKIRIASLEERFNK